MKAQSLLLAASVSLLAWGCQSESPTASNPATEKTQGSAQISISAAKVGQLARAAGPTADINLSKLILTLSAPAKPTAPTPSRSRATARLR